MSKETLKLALEALKGYRRELNDNQPCDAEKALEAALEAHKALAQSCSDVKQEGQSNFCPQCEALARELKAVKQEQGEPTRHELQAKGKHPSPCARFCEANAFEIEIKNLKGDIERAILAEREACLKICEEQAVTAYWEGAEVCVEEIKKRGLKA